MSTAEKRMIGFRSGSPTAIALRECLVTTGQQPGLQEIEAESEINVQNKRNTSRNVNSKQLIN